MAGKDKISGGGKFMDNAKGMCAYKDNPMVQPSRTAQKCGPGWNPDQKKADVLLQKAHKDWDSLRGKNGM